MTHGVRMRQTVADVPEMADHGVLSLIQHTLNQDGLCGQFILGVFLQFILQQPVREEILRT